MDSATTRALPLRFTRAGIRMGSRAAMRRLSPVALGVALCLPGETGCAGPRRDALGAFGTPALPGADAMVAPPALLPFDPVAFVERGERVEGDAGLEVVEGNFAYRFIDPASRARFLSVAQDPPRPAKYRVAMGGGCGRMGPLSGAGEPSRAVAHEGRIHLFASESCLATFAASPGSFLEPVERGTGGAPGGEAEGRVLAARIVRWFGTEAIPADAAIELVSTRTERAGGRDYTVVRRHAASAELGYLEFESWDEWASWVEADLGAHDAARADGRARGRIDGSTSAARALDDEQRAAFARQALWEPAFVALLLARTDAPADERREARCTARPVERWTLSDGRVVEGAVLEISWRDASIRWLVDEREGRPLAARGVRRLPSGRVGEDLVSFGGWASAGGVTVPLSRTAGDGATVAFDSVSVRR